MSEIKPALTAEEWAELRGMTLPQALRVYLATGREHAVAALALHGQPFGFTAEMVEAIRECADALAHESVGVGVDGAVELARAAADRIAALLPPEGT